MPLLILVEPFGNAGVVEGVSVVGAVENVLLGPAIHHLARQRQHLARTPCLGLHAERYTQSPSNPFCRNSHNQLDRGRCTMRLQGAPHFKHCACPCPMLNGPVGPSEDSMKGRRRLEIVSFFHTTCRN